MNLRAAANVLFIIMKWFRVRVRGAQRSAGLDLAFRWSGGTSRGQHSGLPSKINLAQDLPGYIQDVSM